MLTEKQSLMVESVPEMSRRKRACCSNQSLFITGWTLAVIAIALLIIIAALYTTAKEHQKKEEGTTADDGCIYTNDLVVEIASQAVDFYECAIYHNELFSSNYIYGEEGDISYLSGCYWDLSYTENNAHWNAMQKLADNLDSVLDDDSVKTTEKLRLQWIDNELTLVMTLVEKGHMFAACADYMNDYSWYDDPVLDSGRTLLLLTSIDHTAQDDYSNRVMTWLRGYTAFLPTWLYQMQRAVADGKTHASIVMDFQKQYYIDLLAVDYSLVCDTLDAVTDQVECQSLTAQLNANSTVFSDYFQNTYVPACSAQRPDARSGLWATTDGASVYQAWLDYHLGYVSVAREIYELGLTRVEENREEILATIQLIDPTIVTFEEAAASLSNPNDTRWFVCSNDTSDIIDYVRILMAEIEDGLIPEFGFFAGTRVQVIVTGSASTSSSAADYDHERNFWTSHAYYNVGQYEWCSNDGITQEYYYDKLQLATVAHEAMPGHGHQLQLEAQVDCGLAYPYAFGSTLYTEGWALYAETEPSRMDSDEGEKGLYSNPYNELSYYTGTMLRNVRIVVDPAMHGDIAPDTNYAWSDCVAEMVENSFSEYLSESECERYVQMPAQANAYMIGGIKFSALRNVTAYKLGDCFDPAEFHNVILRWGAMNWDQMDALMATYAIYKLNPDRDDFDSLFGSDIITDEMFSNTIPSVGLGRETDDPVACSSTGSSSRKQPQHTVANLRMLRHGSADVSRPFVRYN